MRVAMYYRNNDVRLEEMPTPTLRPGELLVKVMASGICGSDVLEWYRVKSAPRVLGHEIAGEVVESSKPTHGGGWESHEPFAVGDRVFVTHHVPCNTCRFCLAGHHTACETLHRTNFDPGGFAEFVRVPALNVDRGTSRLPPDVSCEAATFVEPLGCVVRAQRLMGIEPGQTVLVIGSGIGGLLHVKLARSAARIIATDIQPYRLDFARRCGADAVIDVGTTAQGPSKPAHGAGRESHVPPSRPVPDPDSAFPEQVRSLNDGRLADRVIVCAGAPSAIRQALSAVERGGKVLFFAVPPPGADVPIDLAALWRNEVTLLTSYGAAPNDLAQALDLIHSRRLLVDDLITHRLPLSETQLGFQLVAAARESVKVIIEPQA
jgi:L-iditol 2-dehydrogenase